jgi:hypothetical protein
MKSNQPQADSSIRPGGLRAVFFLAVFAGVAAIVFHALWPPGTTLMTTDDNVGLQSMIQRMLEASLLHPWQGEVLWGLPAMTMVRPGYFLLAAIPAGTFMNIFHALCLTLSAWFLSLYLRDKGLRPAACVLGGLVAFWVGTNLTLVHAGHVGKYGLMVFLSLAVFALGRWGSTGRRAWSLVAGASAGAMFLEQPDVALFCAFLLVPLGLFEAARAARGWNLWTLAKTSWAAALVAALVAGGRLAGRPRVRRHRSPRRRIPGRSSGPISPNGASRRARASTSSRPAGPAGAAANRAAPTGARWAAARAGSRPARAS